MSASYEGGLHGWTQPDLGLRFSFVAHVGCVRCLAISEEKRTLLSGGDDEVLRVYNLKSFRQIGEVAVRRGTITALSFCGNKHALVACDDGTVSTFRVSDWECVHVFGGHKAGVRSLACHQSGKLALSAGADRTLRLWDLTAGRSAFITRTKGVADVVRWSTKGDFYVFSIGNTLEMRFLEGKETKTLTHDCVLLDLVALNEPLESCIATADGAGALTLWDTATATTIWSRARRGKARVKALSISSTGVAPVHEDRLKSWSASNSLVAATSAGTIELWCLDDDEPYATADVGTRLTCVCVASAARPSAEEKEVVVKKSASEEAPPLKKRKKKKKKASAEAAAPPDDSSDDEERPIPRPAPKKTTTAGGVRFHGGRDGIGRGLGKGGPKRHRKV